MHVNMFLFFGQALLCRSLRKPVWLYNKRFPVSCICLYIIVTDLIRILYFQGLPRDTFIYKRR